MKRTFILTTAAAVLLPVSVMAMPSVGDTLGSDPETVRSALADAGCNVKAFEAEGGMIEAECTEAATGVSWEIYITPADGKIADVKLASASDGDDRGSDSDGDAD